MIVQEWIIDRPGTRPTCWWKFQAPEPRVRCGGIGTPSHERLANVLRLHFGVPMDWINGGILAVYVQLGSDLACGRSIRTTRLCSRRRRPTSIATDCCCPGERRRLSAADFTPERITDILDFGDAS